MTSLENLIATQNTINLPAGYAEALKRYYLNPTSANAQALETVAKSGLTSNVYKSNDTDKNIVITDVNNLSETQRNELTLLAVDLINQARTQLGTDLVVANKDAIAFADEVSDTTKTLAYHDFDAIVASARNHGLKATDGFNEFENLGLLYPAPTSTTMDDLKSQLYEAIRDMLIDDKDSEWGHATSISGLENISKYLGVDSSLTTNRNGVNIRKIHILGVADSQIQDPSKFDTSDNLASRNLTAELANAQTSLTSEKTQLAVAVSANNQALANLAEALTDYDNAVATLKSAQEQLAVAKAVPVQTPTAQANLVSAHDQLVADRAINEKAQQALQALTADVQTKQANLANAKAVLAEKEDALKEAQANLATEQTELARLNRALADAQTLVATRQSELAETESQLAVAEELLYRLQNAPQLLAEAQLAYDEALASLAVAEALLEAETAILDDLKAEQAITLASHAELVSAYEAHVEAERLAKLEVERQAIERAGVVAVPVVDETGRIVGYVDGGKGSASTQAVSAKAVSTSHKVTSNSLSSPVNSLPLTASVDSSAMAMAGFGLLLTLLGFAGTGPKKKTR